MALPLTKYLMLCLSRSPEYNHNSGTVYVDEHVPKILSHTMKNILLELRYTNVIARQVSKEMEELLATRIGTEVQGSQLAMLFVATIRDKEKQHGFQGKQRRIVG